MLLEAHNLKFHIKDRLLIDVQSIRIHKNDRIGLVGHNGSGKTTLLELLAGMKKSSEGGLVSPHTSLELLPQLKNMNTTLSGGEVTQTYIDKVLVQNPDILLADEPTTNLDTNHIEILETQLTKWQGAFIIVSHDRTFLDALCTVIWEIKDGKINKYPGNYSDYATQKKLERKQNDNAYKEYVKKENQLKEALIKREEIAERATKRPKGVSSLEASKSKMYYVNKQKKLRKSATAIETRLDKLEKVQKTKELPAVKMALPNEKMIKGRIVIRATGFKGMVANRKLWNATNFNIRGGDKIAIIGQNGAGKTTLIKKIVNRDEGITISPSLKVGYFSQNLDILNKKESIIENVRSTSIQEESFIRTVLARLQFFKGEVHKEVAILSGGERVKVAFAKLFASDINTLILDEPTNFLDILAIESLENLLQEYDGTILFVSHDRKFIQSIATRILSIENGSIKVFEGTYEEYLHNKNKKRPNPKANELLVLETKISEILGKLSIDPSKELEKEFQKLLKEKKALKDD